MVPRVVLDTNVVVSALRSRRGASAAILGLAGTGRYLHCVSVAPVFEYEAACKRPATGLAVTEAVIDDVLDYLAGTGRRQAIHFRWRPALQDPGDDHVLELAVAAGAMIVTYNRRDFAGAERFGIDVVSPAGFLDTLLRKDDR